MVSPLFAYKFFDFTISAETPLAGLAASEAAGALFQIRLASAHSVATERADWDWQWSLPSGEVFLSVAHGEQGCHLQFPGVLDCLYLADQDSIEILPAAGVSDETIRHLVLDHVLPRLVSHQGRLVLHAAAVADRAGAVLLLGQTGAGKSTLAASLLDEGFELLTDDCVLVEPEDRRFRALPAYRGLRLWSDSARALGRSVGPESSPSAWKHRAVVEAGNVGWRGVQALLVLDRDSGPDADPAVVVEPVSATSAVTELLQHGFLLDPTDRATLERQFLTVGDLAGSLPLFRLTYPRDYSRLLEVRQTLLRKIRIRQTDLPESSRPTLRGPVDR